VIGEIPWRKHLNNKEAKMNNMRVIYDGKEISLSPKDYPVFSPEWHIAVKIENAKRCMTLDELMVFIETYIDKLMEKTK